MMGIITVIAGLGALAGGWFSDRVSRGNPGARMTVCLLYLAVPLLLHGVAFLCTMHGLALPLVISLFCIGQFFGTANWGALVAASLDQSPPPYRASCQSFLPMFQAIAALIAGIVSGLLSNTFGLPMTLLGLLVVGMSTAIGLLWAARRHFDADFDRQRQLGTFNVDLGHANTAD
jgi:MFS family permease